MNRILISMISIAFMFACNTQDRMELHAIENLNGTAVYGDSIANNNFIELAAVLTAMKDESKKDMKIKGIVEKVGHEKACWMTMKLSNGEEMKITFRDPEIMIPENVAGKEVILEGFAYIDSTFIKDVQSQSKEGSSDARVSQITSSKSKLAFLASGVVVMN